GLMKVKTVAASCGTGSGGGTECSTSSCNLSAATTLNSQPICLSNGTNCPATRTPVPSVTPVAGNYIDVTGGTIDFDPTEIGSIGSAVSWGSPADAPVTWTFDTAGADPSFIYGNGAVTWENAPDNNDLLFGIHGDLNVVGLITGGSFSLPTVTPAAGTPRPISTSTAAPG